MKKSNLIFIHKILKAIADSMIKIFIPLYILKNTNNISLAFTYLTLYSVFTVILMFVLKKVIQKYGGITIILHFIPIVATEAILSFCPIKFWFVFACAFLMAISQTFYSIPINLVFNFGDKKANVAKFEISTNIGKLFFTLFSGLILSSAIKNSFLIMSIVSSVVYVCSSIPILFCYKDIMANYDKIIIEKSEAIHTDKKTDFIFNIFHITFGTFQTTMDNVVPLFLYVNNLSFQKITIFVALVEFLKILANYLAKFLISKKQEKLSVTISFATFLVNLIAIVFVKNSLLLYIFSCIFSVSFPLTFVPMFKLYSKYLSKTNNSFDGMTQRDIDIFSLRCPYYASYYVGLGFYPCFALGFISSIVMYVYELKILNKNILETTDNTKQSDLDTSTSAI